MKLSMAAKYSIPTTDWTSCRRLRNKFACRVVALTTQDAMSHAFVALDQAVDDFLLKTTDVWAEDLGNRISAWLRPMDPADLHLLVPTFDRRIRLGPVWVDLEPTGFAILHALAVKALGLPAVTPLAFGEIAEALENRKPGSREGVTLEELKDCMCRVELVSLPEDFMESNTLCSR